MSWHTFPHQGPNLTTRRSGLWARNLPQAYGLQSMPPLLPSLQGKALSRTEAAAPLHRHGCGARRHKQRRVSAPAPWHSCLQGFGGNCFKTLPLGIDAPLQAIAARTSCTSDSSPLRAALFVEGRGGPFGRARPGRIEFQAGWLKHIFWHRPTLGSVPWPSLFSPVNAWWHCPWLFNCIRSTCGLVAMTAA